MEAKAVAKYIRISPRKVRIVMNLIRGKNVADAFAILKFTPKAGADVINKVLKSAVANAENNFDMKTLLITSMWLQHSLIRDLPLNVFTHVPVDRHSKS